LAYSAIDVFGYNPREIGYFKWLPAELGPRVLSVIVRLPYQYNYWGQRP